VSAGANVIKRKSTDSSVTVPDAPSFSTLIAEADKAVAGSSDFDFARYTRSCGIPNRMLLPKGSATGMEFALVVSVTNGESDEQHDALEDATTQSHTLCGIHGEKYPDHQPMGFPLDRRIPDERVFLSSDNNAYTIVKIYFKGEH
jgi:hypothetical protein